jgi:hypothetical protein
MCLVVPRLLVLIDLVTGAPIASVARAHNSSVAGESNVAVQEIVAVSFDKAPSAPAFIAITRYTLPPGTSIASGETTGPRLFIVETGEVTIRSASFDTGFRRAADAPAMSGAGGPDVTLVPGDHYLPVDPTSFELRNDGARAGVFLDAIVFPKAPLGIVPYTTMDGVVVDPLVAGVADAMPGTPVELRIERLDVATGQQFVLNAAPGPRLFVVESGTLGLAAEAGVITYSGAAGNNPGSTAGRVRTVAPGSESLLTARGSVVVQAGANGAASNLGRTRLVLLSLSLLPVIPATPTP